MSFTNLEKTHMVLTYGEVRGSGKSIPRRILLNPRTFVNVVQHLCDFGPFEINKRYLGRQREDRILVAEEEILHEIEN
jgi:hypothetical protein